MYIYLCACMYITYLLYNWFNYFKKLTIRNQIGGREKKGRGSRRVEVIRYDFSISLLLFLAFIKFLFLFVFFFLFFFSFNPRFVSFNSLQGSSCSFIYFICLLFRFICNRTFFVSHFVFILLFLYLFILQEEGFKLSILSKRPIQFFPNVRKSLL